MFNMTFVMMGVACSSICWSCFEKSNCIVSVRRNHIICRLMWNYMTLWQEVQFPCEVSAGFIHWQTDLTHWGRVTHICVSNLTINGSDNGLSPDRRQAIIWTTAGLLLIELLRTNFNEILIEILTFSFKKIRLKVSSVKHRPFCLGLNVLIQCRVLRTRDVGS